MSNTPVEGQPELGDVVEVDELTGELLDDSYDDPSAMDDFRPLDFDRD